MSMLRHMTGPARLLIVGAMLSAALGAQAGAALRPAPAERGHAAAPQQILLSDPELASAEAAGAGWPARAETSSAAT